MWRGTSLVACPPLLVALGCAGPGAAPADAEVVPAPSLVTASPAGSSLVTTSPAGSAPSARKAAGFEVTPEGELVVPGEVSFRVRPLSGPGSMGPSELDPASDAALAHVQRYLEAHPDRPLRVECAVNALRTSSGPNPGYAARLAGLVARRLVELGVPCRQLEVAGRLERDGGAPLHEVRFLVTWGDEAPDAREDPCSDAGP